MRLNCEGLANALSFKNSQKIKKRYDIGATFFEREVDPFVDKLLKEYSLDVKKEEVVRK